MLSVESVESVESAKHDITFFSSSRTYSLWTLLFMDPDPDVLTDPDLDSGKKF